MHRLALLLLLLFPALLLPAAPARGEPFTGAFQDLLSEMNDREAALPATGLTKEQRRERQAQRKFFRALSADGKDLGDDLRIARKVAKALEKGYPGDGTIAALLVGALDDLETAVVVDRDSLSLLVDLLAAGKVKDRAAGKLADADAKLALAAEAPTATLRARELGKARGLLAKGGKIADKGETTVPTGSTSLVATVDGAAWAANEDFGTGVTGTATTWESTGTLRKISFKGRRILPSSGDPRLPGDESTLQFTVQVETGTLEPGTYAVGNSGGVSVGATWIAETEEGALTYALAISGSFTLTAVEVRSGSVAVSGGFSFTMYDGIEGGTFPVTGGTFSASDLPRVDEP